MPPKWRHGSGPRPIRHNVVILQGFKVCCAMMFTKGALLKDAKKLLHKPGENTQAARRFEFTSAAEITKLTSTISAM